MMSPLFQTQLNKSDETWKLLASEADPEVVAGVMWDWMDQLHVSVAFCVLLLVLFSGGAGFLGFST